MTKTVRAEYVAAERTLKLEAPLEGVEDHEHLDIAFSPPKGKPSVRPISDLAGSLSAEAGQALAAAIEEAFGPINDGSPHSDGSARG